MRQVSSRSVEDSFCYIQCDPKDRKMGGVVAIHTGSTHPSEIMLPYQNVELPGLPEAI